MHKPLAAIASALVLTCASAFSHAAAPMPSADPAVVKATKDMFAAMKVREMMTTMMAQAARQMPVQAKMAAAAAINAKTDLTPEQKAEALQKADESIQGSIGQMQAVFSDPTLVDDMIAEMVPLYAETYTLDEIRQLTAFYASPLGQKMQAKMPELMNRSMQISQRVMMPRIQKIMAQSQQAAAGK